MTGINTGKVLVGGLVGGLVMNVIDIATGYLILMNDMKAMLERLHLDASSLDSPASMIPWVIIDFISGILLVFAYAAMRPRFGPGPKTAFIAGLTMYLMITVVLSGFLSVGIFTTGVFVKSAACSLVSVLAASLTGAAVYKE